MTQPPTLPPITCKHSVSLPWLPWGVRLDPKTLRLLFPTPGSVAAESAVLLECVGMVLAEMNGVPLRTIDDACWEDGVTALELVFRPFCAPCKPAAESVPLAAVVAPSTGEC